MSVTRAQPVRFAPTDSIPKAGSQPSITENRMIISKESQKSGVA